MYRNSYYSVVSRIIMSVGKILFILGVSRYYGPEGQGIISVGLTVMVTLTLLLSFGVELSNTYFAGQNHRNTASLIMNSAVLSAFSIVPAWVIISAGFYLFGDSIFRGYPDGSKVFIIILVPTHIFQILLQGLMFGLNQFRGVAVAVAIQFVFLISGLIVVVWLKMSLLTIFVLWMCAGMLTCIYYLTALPPQAKDGWKMSTALLKQQIVYGSKGMIGNAANYLNFRTDFYLVAYFWSPLHVGWYSIASTIAEGLLYLPKAMGSVIFSGVANGTAEDKINLLFRYSILASGVIMIIGLLIIPFIIPLLLGSSFAPAVFPTQILLVGTFMFGIGYMTSNYLYGHGLPSLPTEAALTTAMVTIVLDFISIPIWGINGAAMCSLTAYALYTVLNIRKMKNIDHLHMRSPFYFERSDIMRLLTAAREGIQEMKKSMP